VPLTELSVADKLAERLKKPRWHVARDPLLGQVRPDFMLDRDDGVSVIADVTLEDGVVHSASLGQVASYRGQVEQRAQGRFAFVLLTTGEQTPEVADIAHKLDVRVITVARSRRPTAIAERFANALDQFSHFSSLEPGQPPWSLAPLFHEATSAELARLSERVQLKRYAKGDTIYRIDSAPDAVYVVTDGKVRLTFRRVDGSERHAWRHQLSIFGEMAALDQRPRIVTARAMTKVDAWMVPTDAFLELVAANANVRRALHDVLTQVTRDQVRNADGGVDLLRDIALAMRNGPPPPP
jgi:CRP-like cAMP-binding protein